MARDENAPEFDDETTVIASADLDADGSTTPPSTGPDAVGRPARAAIGPAPGPAEEPEPVAVVPPGPALVASGLGLLTDDGWIFKDIDLTLRPSSVAAIVGPAGTGRSCLLLALSGRMRANTGTLTVAGHSYADNPKGVRAVTAVARIGSLTGPEPGLTISESVAEQSLLEDVKVQVGRARFAEACEVMQLTFDPKTLVGRLSGDQATLFAVALASVRVSAVLLLDDLDRDVSAANQQRMLEAIIRLARNGPTVVVSTTDRIPVMGADVVLDLTPDEGATTWHLDPIIAPPGTVLRQLDPGGLQRDPARPELGPGSNPGSPDAPTEDPR